jgi:uncharacterized OB-fold protein
MAHISVPSIWRSLPQKYRLAAKKCKSCKTVNFPPRQICMECGASDFEDYVLPRDGEVYSYTIVAEGSTASEYAEEAKASGPFPIAIVKLSDGTKVMGQVTDCELKEMHVGMKVRMTFRRMYEEDGLTKYGYKFKPC